MSAFWFGFLVAAGFTVFVVVAFVSLSLLVWFAQKQKHEATDWEAVLKDVDNG